MSYNARVLCDSVSPAGGRLTTLELTFPRFLLPEFNTHRMLSRNAASSRAIPIKKRIEAVRNDPFIPEYWGANQKGMQADQEITAEDKDFAERFWRNCADAACCNAEWLESAHVHKQLANRLLEPFSWVTVIASATEWANFFWLRCHKDAQPEFRKIACLARDVYYESQPKELDYGEWHLPLIEQEDRLAVCNLCVNGYEHKIVETLCKVSVGRCARVSYLTHDGKRDVEEDIKLCNRLIHSGHWSPFEHVATPIDTHSRLIIDARTGNFRGWKQFRKDFEFENRSQLAKDPLDYER